MVLLELGTFIVFNILGFGLTVYGTQASLPLAKPLALFGMISFLVLAFWMLQPTDVGVTKTSTATDGSTTWTQTTESTWISDEFTNYLQWVYFGLAVLAFLVFALKVII